MMTARVVFDQVNLVVDDMEAVVGFYEALGIEVSAVGPADWLPHHRSATVEGADLDLDSTAFAAVWNSGSTGPGIVLGFRVESREAVDELYQALTAAGHQGQQAPYDAFWGARYAIVTDPAGSSVGLMSPSDPARRSPPVLPGD
jgi:uncharacterized glyoxalase superfamily protein PhnB